MESQGAEFILGAREIRAPMNPLTLHPELPISSEPITAVAPEISAYESLDSEGDLLVQEAEGLHADPDPTSTWETLSLPPLHRDPPFLDGNRKHGRSTQRNPAAPQQALYRPGTLEKLS